MFFHIFLKAENQERGQSEFHGIGGPLISIRPKNKLAYIRCIHECS